MDLSRLEIGEYKPQKTSILFRGKEVVLHRMEVEVTETDDGLKSINGTAEVREKIIGLVPSEELLEIRFTLEGVGDFSLKNFLIFDMDIQPSEVILLQFAGIPEIII